MAKVELVGVSKRYGAQLAVRDLTLTVEDGAFVVLLGPTGAGKTTVLRLVAGLEVQDRGDIRIDGHSVRAQSPAARNVAMVFQNYSLYPHMTVRENLAFPLRSPLHRRSEAEIESSILSVAETLRIAHKLDTRVTTLSGGEMQRVSIGRALVRHPHVHLMDEPLSSLDARLRSELREELKRIHRECDATLLYVTHDQLEALTLASEIGVLVDGKLEQFGPPREIYEQPDTVGVARALGQPRINLLPATLFGNGPAHAELIGIRAERVVFGRGRQARVLRVERLGDQARVHLDVKGYAMIVLADSHTAIAPESEITIEPHAPLFFDRDGNRIAGGGVLAENRI